MSQVYATEPSTSGRVLLETTHGPIEVHLWCRECPATVRLFLQLALDGYYDGLVFHRILSNFLIQTGLRQEWSAWKQRNASLVEQYLERRTLERHSRIKFNHRGQVAMALPLNESDVLLEPQFFITLDEAPYLNEKHLVFGTVAMGPTVFNALRIGSVTNVDDQGQPLDIDDAPRIKSTKVISYELEHPSTLHASTFKPWNQSKNESAKKKKKQRKGKRDVNVLSFGDDEEEAVSGGMQSSHDVLDGNKTKNKGSLKKEDLPVKDNDQKDKADNDNNKQEDNGSSKEQPILPEIPRAAPLEKSLTKGKDGAVAKNKNNDISLNQRQPEKINAPAPPLKQEKRKKASSGPSAVEAKRMKYLQKGSKNKKQREDDTMAKLLAFQGKVRVQHKKQNTSSSSSASNKDDSLASRMAQRQAEQNKNENAEELPTYRGQVLDDSDSEKDQQGADWLSTKFHCRQHMDHRARGGSDGRNMDDYVVIDQKKGKHTKTKKRHRETRR